MKKTTKGLLSALLLTAMCGTVGCKSKESSTVTPSTGTQISSTSTQQVTVEAQNLLSSIVDSGDGCYTVTEADGKTTVAFNKPAGKEWASAKVDLSGIANKEKMNTLRFKVSGVGQLILKFEGTAGTAEVKLFVYDTESNYEWGFVDEDFAKIGAAHSLIIFAAAGGAGEGSVSFSELTLTPALAGDDTSYQIITTNYKNFIDGPHVYDGISSEFHFNSAWECGDGDVYTFENVEGGIKVNYTKLEQTREWAAALTPVAGDFSKFNYVNFKVNGTKGKQFTIKVTEAVKEKCIKDSHFNFSGTEDTFSLDISNLTPEVKRTIGNILFFAEGGAYGENVAGSLTVYDAWFSATMPDSAKENTYLDGVEFNANKYWKYDDIYNVTEADGKSIISWENVPTEGDHRWKAAWTDFKGDVSVFGELEYSITVNAKTAIRIEIPGCGLLGDILNLESEESQTFTGSFDLSKFTKDQLANAKQIRVYPRMALNDNANEAEGEQKEFDIPVSGSIEINRLTFVGGKTNVDAETGAVDVKTAGWVGNYCTYEAVEDGVKINYTRGHTDWSGYRFRINKGSLTGKNYTKVVVEFTGTEGKGGVFKLETEGEYSGVEEKYLNESWNDKDRGFFTGAKQTLEIDITTLKADKDIRFIVFAAPTPESGGAEAGSLVINSVTFVA